MAAAHRSRNWSRRRRRAAPPASRSATTRSGFSYDVAYRLPARRGVNARTSSLSSDCGGLSRERDGAKQAKKSRSARRPGFFLNLVRDDQAKLTVVLRRAHHEADGAEANNEHRPAGRLGDGPPPCQRTRGARGPCRRDRLWTSCRCSRANSVHTARNWSRPSPPRSSPEIPTRSRCPSCCHPVTTPGNPLTSVWRDR